MANIDEYIRQIEQAEYGEEVRSSIVNALKKVNDDNNSYADIKKEIIAAKDAVDDQVDAFDGKVAAAQKVIKDLITATSTANQAKTNLDASVKTANTAKSNLEYATDEANTAKSSVEQATSNANKAVTNANAAKGDLEKVISSAGTTQSNLQNVINAANQIKGQLDTSNETAATAKKNLDVAIGEANKAKTQLSEVIESAGQIKTSLSNLITQANQIKLNLDSSVTAATNAKKELDAASSVVNNSIEEAIQTKSKLDESVNSALTANTTLNDTLTVANTTKKNLDNSVNTAVETKSTLDQSVKDTEAVQTSLSKSVKEAEASKSNLDASVTTANQVLQSLDSENTAAASNIEELRSENFNSQEILSGVADLRAYLGLTDDDIVGVQIDYKNKTFKRIAGAVNLTKGADFDRFSMFGGRRRCNVADDGTIVAWYGDPDYKEDGTMGQVMVYQPKFYYLVCPVVYDPIETGIGYHLRKANYYVSEKARAGFRLHPAFYDAEGNEIDYFLTSAYEGSIWDADGGSGSGAYLMKDEQVMNLATDKFCSIAGVKPASGLTQNLTRPNIETLAKNRGNGWHGDLIKQVSAEQLLMIIEMGMMNMQTAIAQGIVSIADSSSYNCSSLTGSTAALGNGTGRATETVNTKGDASTTETADGKTAVCWRGKENFWGNIWKFVYGVNIWGNGNMGGGQPYICNDFNFAESKNSGNYEGAGFTVSNVAGYISAMGYSTTCDWLFMASECTGNSSLPVGDYTYITQNLNTYRIALLGGYWNYGGYAGTFYWYLDFGVGYRYRYIGGRLVFIPTRGSEVYDAAIASWKEQMAA